MDGSQLPRLLSRSALRSPLLLRPLPLALVVALGACGGASDDGLYGGRTHGSGGSHPILPKGPTGGMGGAAGSGAIGGGFDAGVASGGSPQATGGAGGTSGSGAWSGGAAAGGTDGKSGNAGGAQCAAMCGGPASDGSCWCDSACKLYSDCCADFESACPAQANAPLGQGCTPKLCNTVESSTDANGICYCDADCTSYGDCCSNKPEVCGS